MSEANRIDYDPNMVLCGRLAEHTYKFTFGMWDYRVSLEATARGNVIGFDMMDAAISNLADALLEPVDNDEFRMELQMTNPMNEVLICENHEGEDPEDWLKKMIVGAELVNFTEYNRKSKTP